MGGELVGCWRIHGVGAYTHPPMNSYNVKIFNFMNTNPPTHQTYPKCKSVTIHILWSVHGVGGGGVVGGFMGWVVGWVVGGFMGWVGVWCVGGVGAGGWRVHRVNRDSCHIVSSNGSTVFKWRMICTYEEFQNSKYGFSWIKHCQNQHDFMHLHLIEAI